MPLVLVFLFLVSAISFAPAQSQSFEFTAKQAESARMADKVSDAIRLYKRALALRPSWSDGWLSLGSLLYDQDRFAEAEVAFKHFVPLTPRPGPAYAFLGLCEYETHDYDSALQHFRAWANLRWPGTPELMDVAVFHFALLLTKKGDFLQALYLLSPLAIRLGDTPTVTEAMGLASLRMTSLPEDYPREDREPIWLAGEAAALVQGSSPDFVTADQYANRLEYQYGNRPEVHYFLGTILSFERKDPEAQYREELRISPQHVPAMLGVASADLAKGKVEEALSLSKRAIELEPRSAEAHQIIGRLLLSNGQLEESVRELEFAKQLAPSSYLVRSQLAIAYGRMGHPEKARAEAAASVALQNKAVLLPPQEQKSKPNDKEKSQ